MKVKHEGKTINSTKVNWNEDELYIYIYKKKTGENFYWNCCHITG
jgi:hypothetical protein